MGMVDITCICGKDMKVWHYDSKGDKNQQHCGDACRQRAYRMTERGKANTKKYNERYRQPEKECKCFICNKVFMSARERTLCDEHSTPYYHNQKFKASRPDIIAGIRHNGNLHEKIKRGTMKKPVCTKCGKESDVIHFHHPDYARPREVVALCPDCHVGEQGIGAVKMPEWSCMVCGTIVYSAKKRVFCDEHTGEATRKLYGDEYNKRFKRPEKEYTCSVCSKVFTSTRKRVFCTEHSTRHYRNQRTRGQQHVGK